MVGIFTVEEPNIGFSGEQGSPWMAVVPHQLLADPQTYIQLERSRQGLGLRVIKPLFAKGKPPKTNSEEGRSAPGRYEAVVVVLVNYSDLASPRRKATSARSHYGTRRASGTPRRLK